MSGATSSLMEALGEPLRMIWRHGGRSSDRWRVVFRSYSSTESLARYERESQRMRQGTIELREYKRGEAETQDAGRRIVYNTAPRLRTRW